MATPQFSVVTALYEMAEHVGRYFASLDAQTFDSSLIEVIVVDDGSTDAGPQLVRDWAESTDLTVHLLHKQNGGQASARNLGLDHVTGEWVTFIDPDDAVTPTYFANIAAMIARQPAISAASANIDVIEEHQPDIDLRHPRRAMYWSGDHVADLDHAAERFPGSAPTTFFRHAVLEEHHLRFNENLRPNFEDGDFSCRYMLLAPNRLMAFVDSASYRYHKRSSSTLASTRGHAGRFTTVPREGFLGCLEFAREREGHVPMWVQHLVLYELTWYFGGESSRARMGGSAAEEFGPEFRQTLTEISTYLDPDVIDSATIRRWPPVWVAVMTQALPGHTWSAEHLTFDRYETGSKLIRTRHLRTPDAAPVAFWRNGEPYEPVFKKTRPLEFWGATMLVEDIAWLPNNRWLKAESARGALEWREPETYPKLRHPAPRQLRKVALDPPPEIDEPITVSQRQRNRYADAWLLCDRVHDADDSGEALFKYLQRDHPHINAWFVLEKGVPDWTRLKAEGHGRRLLAYGSKAWKAAMTQASHVISSHADQAIQSPDQTRHQTRPDQRFVFLQHGVIKDDLSDWLNSKPIDLFVTSTPDEYESIVGDTRYLFTGREVALTGLPRFDVLRAEAERTPEAARNLVLVAPTWRSWLAAPLSRNSQRRGAVTEIGASEFGREWGAFLRSPHLRQLCREHDAQLALLAHPNLASSLAYLDLPDDLVLLDFEDAAAKRHFARTRVLVTDYSSMAFNAAYLDRHVVYFQFDREAMLGGEHVGRRGYFDYDTLGVGPSVDTLDDAVAAVGAALAHGQTPIAPFGERIERMFPERDGQCSKRVVEAILALDRPPRAR